jgi:mannose-1-phosphate guanylyltransferase
MKAMILAAGKGTRVRPLTHLVPKPMIPVLGRPVMEYLIDLLRQHGVEQVMVNTSYKAPQIEDYFRDGSRFGVEIAYSFEGELADDGALVDAPVGSAGGLARIQEHSGFFDSTFVVLCGDAIVDLDLGAALDDHRRSGALATIVCKRVERQEVSSYGIVVADESGRVSSFQEKPRPEEARSDLANTGIYIFEPAVFDHIPRGESFDIGSQLFPALVEAGAALHAVEARFRWIDIGNAPDYWAAVQHLLTDGRDLVRLPGREVRPGVWAGLNVRADWDRITCSGPVVVGGSSRIEPGATIVGPAVIGPGCVVEAGARVERSVLFDHTRVSGHAAVVDMVVAGRWCVSRDGAVVDLAASDLGWAVDDARRRSSEGRPSPLLEA